jgi:UDP-N-acetylmuramate dehydrogenase
MTPAVSDLVVERNAPIDTWFAVGGRADALVRPAGMAELGMALREFAGAPTRVLGDGANLLVGDEGVDGLVIATKRMARVRWPEGPMARIVYADAGAGLQRLVVESVRRGLSGLEGLGGVPASLGGAVRMNAGGAYGQMSDVVERVFAVTRRGEPLELTRENIAFDYRHSGLDDLIITGAELRLSTDDPDRLRDRLKEVMSAKKTSQPLGADSAGCAFRNPLVEGVRVSAGKLIDEAGCKGLRIGGASVSEVHANFILADPTARAGDVLELMDRVVQRVSDHCGVTLQREVVIWRRGEAS